MAKFVTALCILRPRSPEIVWSGHYFTREMDDFWRIGLSWDISKRNLLLYAELTKRGDNLMEPVVASFYINYHNSGYVCNKHRVLCHPSKSEFIINIPVDSGVHGYTKRLGLTSTKRNEDVPIIKLESESSKYHEIVVGINYTPDVSVSRGYVYSKSASLEDDISTFTTSSAGLECADIELIGSDGSVFTHSFLLKCRSYVLMTFIEYHTVDGHESTRIKLPHVPKAVLEDFVSFIERDTVNKLNENAMDLLILADQFFVRKLTTICEEYLISHITPSNIDEVQKLTAKVQSKPILNAIDKYLSK